MYVCNENSEYYYLPKSDEIALGGAAEQKCEAQKINMWQLWVSIKTKGIEFICMWIKKQKHSGSVWHCVKTAPPTGEVIMQDYS